MTRRMVPSLVPILLLVLADAAAAQTQPLRITQDTEYLEFGGDVGMFNLMGWGMVGGHVTRNYTNWLAGEAALHGFTGDAALPAPAYAVFAAEARLQGRVASDRLAFVTVGVARAFGLSYRYSPVVGVGMQSATRAGSAGWRVDLQRFPSGRDLYGGGRLMIGFVVAP